MLILKNDFFFFYLHNTDKRITLVTVLGANIFVSSGGLLKLGDFGSSIKLKNPLQTVYGEISNIRGTVGEREKNINRQIDFIRLY